MLESIIRLSINAGNLLMESYQSELIVRHKIEDNSPVTIADIKADTYIRSELQKLFPNDKILSEETQNNITDYSGRVWIVDPLDGTRTFTEDKEGFSNIIGLCIDGVPVLGVVYAPAMNELFYASKNSGAYLINAKGLQKLQYTNLSNIEKDSKYIKKLHVSNISKINNARILIKKDTSELATGTRIMKIAKGEAEIYTNDSLQTSKWDLCGNQIILEEAGGKLTDKYGNPINYMSQSSKIICGFIATNKHLHEEMVRR